MDKPRIISIKEKEGGEQTAQEAQAAPQPAAPQPQARPEEPKLEAGPPWVQRDLIQARKRNLPEAAEKVIEEQAKDILPTIPEPGQPITVGEKKPLAKRLFGWLFK